MIKIAVILAAGLGSRLQDTFSEKPKGLFPIEGIPLVERSIRQLQAHNIERVILVTGYMAHCYEALASRFSGVETVHNPYFADSGSFYSLYCARHAIDQPFLLLESDLIYEDRALRVLLETNSADSILISGTTHSNDEVYIEAHDNCLKRMSKRKADLTHSVGEFVGICKLSLDLLNTMVNAATETFAIEQNKHVSYEEDALTTVAQYRRIPLCKVNDLLWSEIDNADHVERVLNHVWPRIHAIETNTKDKQL